MTGFIDLCTSTLPSLSVHVCVCGGVRWSGDVGSFLSVGGGRAQP